RAHLVVPRLELKETVLPRQQLNTGLGRARRSKRRYRVDGRIKPLRQPRRLTEHINIQSVAARLVDEHATELGDAHAQLSEHLIRIKAANRSLAFGRERAGAVWKTASN